VNGGGNFIAPVLGLLRQCHPDREEAQDGHDQHQQVRHVDQHVGRQRVRCQQAERDRDQRRVAGEERADALWHGLAGPGAGRGRDREREDEEHGLLDEPVVDHGLRELVEAQHGGDDGEAEQARVGLQADDGQHARRGRGQMQHAPADQPADQRGGQERHPAERDPEADVGVDLEPGDVEEHHDRRDDEQQQLEDPASPHARARPRAPLRLHPRRDRGGDGEGDPEHRPRLVRGDCPPYSARN
jgi:hypothetical protein